MKLALKSLITRTALSSFIILCSCTKNPIEETKNSFRFNLPREIHSLDPLLLRGTAKRFVLFNLHRGLFYYNKDNELTHHGAKDCEWITSLKLQCSLNDKKWSDGIPITAEHYLHTYKLIKKEKEESGEFLTNIKNLEVLKGDLVFTLKKENSKFKHELTHVYFSPRKEKVLYQEPLNQVFSGPYKVKRLDQSKIMLVNNEHYNSFKRPPITGVFIDDPNAALNMYSVEGLDFLRYLETSNIPKYPNRYMAPFARLDGIFFNPDHIKDENLRKALFFSLNYKGLQKIFHTPSRPGCISLPDFFFSEPIPCYEQNIEKAKEYLKKVTDLPKRIRLYIPSVSSNEHQKLALWAREGWKKNLGLNIKIEQIETGVFYESVRLNKFSIYRKSVSLKNLSCFDAIETVKTQPEFKNHKINSQLNCTEFFKDVLSQYIWLPLGLPSFAHLHSKNYSGYYINMLGQFGLERLKKNKKKTTRVSYNG